MSCSCHINPPCSYCLSTYECTICGETKHSEEDGQEFLGDDIDHVVCYACYRAKDKEGEV